MRHSMVILDDEPDRIEAMLDALRGVFPKLSPIVFDNAPEMVDWLHDGLETVTLICLDHDLGPNRRRGELLFDPGIGRDVADFLARQTPTCPVLIHTTNHIAAPGMLRVLQESGWQTSQVTPYGDLEWIGEVWVAEVRRILSMK
ncbi:MAG: hypothetical protein KF708_13820 [Pirellulales bacterium]|nr:hypothetical protein [Pirellulales bacterium]